MAETVKLSRQDAARAFVAYHFSQDLSLSGAFHRLGSIQFDPISPVGCNHDLVLQTRVPGYKVGDWQKITYADRQLYDGWDKQASLVPLEGWPLRRVFHHWHRGMYQRIPEEHPEAIDAILGELQSRGPLMPRDCDFQHRREDWKTSWHGPNVSKQTLRALWHIGKVVTTGRKNGHHVYDLTERVIPAHLLEEPLLSESEAVKQIVLERHRAVGILRPTAAWEVWSLPVKAGVRNAGLKSLVDEGFLIPVEIEGVKSHATPHYLEHLEAQPSVARVRFVAPLDQFMWDRKMIQHLFGFDYIWEIYTPEPKRKWGYYVLPILYGNQLVARIEFSARKGVLEVRQYHQESGDPGPDYLADLRRATKEFMGYCGAKTTSVEGHIAKKVAKALNFTQSTFLPQKWSTRVVPLSAKTEVTNNLMCLRQRLPRGFDPPMDRMITDRTGRSG